MSSIDVHPLNYSDDITRMNPVRRFVGRNRWKVLVTALILVMLPILWIKGVTLVIVRVDDFIKQESNKAYRLGVGNTKIFECSLPTAFQDNVNSLWQGQETMLSRWNLGAVDRRFGVSIKCVSGLSNLGDSPDLLKKYINQKMADQSIVLRRQVFIKSWTKSMKTLHYVIYNKSELQKLYDDADEEIAKAISH